MPDIVLSDLLAWEPRLQRVDGPHGDVLNPEVSWVVTGRVTAPLLPTLRGGEVVVLPDAAVSAVAGEMPTLMEQLRQASVAAVVVPKRVLEVGIDARGAGPLLLSWSEDPLGPEIETEVNRLLTQQRGEMYRSGMEFGRRLAAMTTAAVSTEEMLRRSSEETGFGIRVLGPSGVPVLEFGEPSGARGPGRVADVRLANGQRLEIVACSDDQAALARMFGERLALALEATIARVDRERPRGPSRIAAIRELLLRDAPVPRPEAASLAATLALPVDAEYRVVLVPGRDQTGTAEGWLRSLGIAHEAGTIENARAWLVQSRPGRGDSRPAVPETIVAAASGPGALGSVPLLARQARFVAGLLATGAVTGPVARFDVAPDLGAFRLLFDLWGAPSLGEFVDATLGTLPEDDRRGDLRQTLLAFLESGGSQVEAAARLGVHRNTLAYRLRRIARATGSDPADPARRLALHLALLAQQLPPPPAVRPREEGWAG